MMIRILLRASACATAFLISDFALVHAQRPTTLSQALAAAEDATPRLRLARADSAAAAARVITARALENPSLSVGYSKSPPPYHVEAEQPFEMPWVRRARITAAVQSAQAAGLGVALERARLRHDVEVAYANASISSSIVELSAQNALDADELVRIAISRRDAGDAADLDVDLARVFAAGQHRAAAIDSLSAATALLELQGLMGVSNANVEIAVTDTFVPLLPSVMGNPLALRQAELQRDASASELAAAAKSHGISQIAIRAGFETGDPDQRGLLPTIGFSIPISIFNRNAGPIAEAQAARDAADAQLQQAERQREQAVAISAKQREVQLRVLQADREGLEDARRVASRTQTAYREGEYPLASVIEAQRNARDALRQYYDDMATLWLAQAASTLARETGIGRTGTP